MTSTGTKQGGFSLLRRLPMAVPVRLLVGGTLVFSGAAKLPMRSQFVEIVKSYHLLPNPLATVYALALPWVEFVIGAYLLLGILVKPSVLVSILMAISFMVANIGAIMRGEEHYPGCFGKIIVLSIWQSLGINFLIILLGLYLVVGGESVQKLSFDDWYAKRRL